MIILKFVDQEGRYKILNSRNPGNNSTVCISKLLVRGLARGWVPTSETINKYSEDFRKTAEWGIWRKNAAARTATANTIASGYEATIATLQKQIEDQEATIANMIANITATIEDAQRKHGAILVAIEESHDEGCVWQAGCTCKPQMDDDHWRD